MKDPETIVKAFITDYCQWNDRAYERSKSSGVSEEILDEAESEYAELLRRYCRPGFSGQTIAFGSHSSHSPRTETIREIILEGEHATVKTVAVDSLGFEANYEYSLAFADGRWFLEAVDYIDEEGRYPGL